MHAGIANPESGLPIERSTGLLHADRFAMLATADRLADELFDIDHGVGLVVAAAGHMGKLPDRPGFASGKALTGGEPVI